MKYSISSLTLYRNCPSQYLKLKVLKQPPEIQVDEFYALYGTVAQKVFEIFYNENCWKKGTGLLDYLKLTCKKSFLEEVSNRYIAWDRHEVTPREFYRECEDAILLGLAAIKQEKLIAPYSRSEVSLVHRLDNGDKLTGRIDFIFKFSGGRVLIVDGKGNSKKNADFQQLLYYATLYYLNFNVIPDRLGFLYWRYGCVKWYNYVDSDKLYKYEYNSFSIKNTFEEAQQTIQDINNSFKTKEWPETPSKACFFCAYKKGCKQFNIKKTKRVENKMGGESIFDTDVLQGLTQNITF